MIHPCVCLCVCSAWFFAAEPLPVEEGYRGIWYSNQPQEDEYAFKYSGGMATYPQQHLPIAYYAPAVNKTFFCYGGVEVGGKQLVHMVSYFDHATGMVPKPRKLLDKKTTDAHDNPTIQIDDAGHLWIFSNAHGTSRPAFIHRSVRPYDIDAFEQVLETNFSYSQPWYLPGEGFLFLHTRYQKGRKLFFMTSPDGRQWSEPVLLASIAQGHYQVSGRHENRIATMFNYHPDKGGLNARTNVYFLQTADGGKTWTTAAGEAVTLPLQSAGNPTLVHDYQAEGKLVYLKDVQFTAGGDPILLYLTSHGYRSGPSGDPRQWHTARWTGKDWEILPAVTSDHNYDYGSLYVEKGPTGEPRWRLIAPTLPGPQPYGTGGEMVLWLSDDQGKNWRAEKTLTQNSVSNHSYARRPFNAHPDFYALWADGNARQRSESRLFFTNRDGDAVWQLPTAMRRDFEKPLATVTGPARP